jgi:hypothetical protein
MDFIKWFVQIEDESQIDLIKRMVSKNIIRIVGGGAWVDMSEPLNAYYSDIISNIQIGNIALYDEFNYI